VSQRLSICRVCHNACGVVVEVDDDTGRAVSMIGDRENPLYRGYMCVKGRASPSLHNAPDRLLQSMKRTAGGGFEPIDVEQAMDEIAGTLRHVLDDHGPRSIAGYFGTGVVASAFTIMTGFGFFDAIGSPMKFACDTIDQPGKTLARGCHGDWMAPGTGWVNPDVVMLVGCNPLVSHAGFPLGNPGGWLKDQLARGMKLIVIDPRRTDVARRATLHLQPKPGHDAAIFAAMLRIIIDEDRYDRDFVTDNVSGLVELRHAVRPFDPAEVAIRAGIDVEDLVRAARMFSDHRWGYVACGTGPSMSGWSTLVEYLRMNLETLCGHWLRAGDALTNASVTTAHEVAKAQAMPPYPTYGDALGGERTRTRGLSQMIMGMPTAALAEEILLPGEGQVRALVSCAGNPVAAWPDQLKTIEALRSLELLVSIDHRMTPTARLSHYVIAPKMHLEIPGTTWTSDGVVMGTGFGNAHSFGQYTPAIVDPPHGSDLIEDWEFWYGVARRLGVPLPLGDFLGVGVPFTFDPARKPTHDELEEVYMADARISLDELKRHPHGAFFPDPKLRVEPKDEGWEGRLDVANADMLADLAAIADALDHPVADEGEFPLRLISRRMMHVLNSATNVPETNRGRAYNPAFMHPSDIERLGLHPGDIVEIRSPFGAILGVVGADSNVREGLVSMSHAFGGVPEEDDRVREIGGPTARLSSVEHDYDRHSGQPRMSDIPVMVSPHKETAR